MSRMLKVLLFLCVAAAFAAAASPKKNPDVEKAVKSELVKKTFATKILVGGYIPCPPNVNTSGHSDAIKPVDTEVTPNGSIQYLARANCFYSVPSGVIDLGVIFDSSRFYTSDPISGSIPVGTTVWVRSVDFKEDRVEVNVNANGAGNGSAGKIKYMLGANYRTMTLDELMDVIARGILIPAREQMIEVKTEFEALQASLGVAEGQYNSVAGNTDAKLASAIALQGILERIQKNRAAFISMGMSDPQAGVYSEKSNALTPEIVRLTAELHRQRVTQIQEQLRAQLEKLTDVQNQVRKQPPVSVTEWQQRSESLVKYSALLDERQTLLNKLQGERESPSPEDVKLMSDGKAEIETAKKALEKGHQQIELVDTTTQYAQLTKKRAQLLDAYTRAFGTAKEKSTLQDLIAVLGQMVTNRDRAAGLGDKAAPAQLIKCRAEAEKYKRK